MFFLQNVTVTEVRTEFAVSVMPKGTFSRFCTLLESRDEVVFLAERDVHNEDARIRVSQSVQCLHLRQQQDAEHELQHIRIPRRSVH